MATTLKLKVNNKVPAYNGAVTFTLYADYADGANKEWADASPSVSMTFTVKKELADILEAGDSVTVTLEK